MLTGSDCSAECMYVSSSTSACGSQALRVENGGEHVHEVLLRLVLTGLHNSMQVWQIIADKTRPVLQAVPMFRIPLDFVKRSFDQPR